MPQSKASLHVFKCKKPILPLTCDLLHSQTCHKIMSLKFDVKKKHVVRSERVKSVHLHPELPWVLSGLYTGSVTIQDYSTQSLVKTIEVSTGQQPIRSARFLPRKQWIVTVSDDLQVRVFNYNTNEKIKAFDAHTDYIRCVVIHPQYLFTSSDDTTIKAWDFENNFQLVRTYEDHVNYVMMVALNPRDPNTFATASMDRTVKVWTVASPKPNFTLQGHESGVNCVDFHRGDKPYLISGGDDRVIRVWDYQTKQCIHILEAHQQNISGAIFHPDLPLIVSTAEDGVIRFWHANTYKLENSLNYNMERVWSIDVGADNTIAFGFDEGTVVVKLGQDEPVVSMSQGKVVYAQNFEFFTINLKAVTGQYNDGANIPTTAKDLGISDIYPAGVRHSPNGHSFAVYSDSEYSIYRAQNFKNAGFGQGTDLVWGPVADSYAVRDAFSIKTYKNNALAYEMKTDYQVEQLFQGPLLGARSSEFLIFYEWETGKLIRRIDEAPKKLYWNETGTALALCTTDKVYFLNFFQEQLALYEEETPDGCEDAFDLTGEITASINSGCWIQGLFYYTTQSGKLAYTVNEKIFIVDQDRKSFILGYVQAQNKLYLMDKNKQIQSYEVNSQVAEFQSLIVLKKLTQAEQLIKNIPEIYLDKLARFLDELGQKPWAYQLAKDKEHKFDLALQLQRVDDAFEIALVLNDPIKLRQVGDLALTEGRIKISVQAFEAAEDLGGLLLIFTSLGLKERLQRLAQKALEQTKMNIAFAAFFTLADLEGCMEVLIRSKRFPEAAFFAKTYCPSRISLTVKLWKESLQKSHPVIAQKIADPFDYPAQFGDLQIALKVEEFYVEERKKLKAPPHEYLKVQEALNFDLFTMLKESPDYDLSKFTLKP